MFCFYLLSYFAQLNEYKRVKLCWETISTVISSGGGFYIEMCYCLYKSS